MIPENSDSEAMIAQADIHRFYVKVIRPALTEFAPADEPAGGETKDLEVFFENARIATHNALCREMRRTFVLILEALFERQLRSWLSRKKPTEAKRIEEASWPKLVRFVDEVDDSIGQTGVMKDLEVVWLVANAVRHGKGGSTAKLLKMAPHFWDHARMKADSTDLVSRMRVDDAELDKYVITMLKFWHLAGASSLP